MPLSWVGRRDGGQASASPGTDREGIPAGRGYTSARVAVGQTRKVPKRHYLLIRSTSRARTRRVTYSVAMSAGLAPLRMRFEMAGESADDVGDVGYFGPG